MIGNERASDRLRNWLSNVPPGEVVDAHCAATLLASCWHELVGGDSEGMHAGKLTGRVEALRWDPPVLSFTIERHGGTVLGSTRAELQNWRVDIEQKTAECQRSARYRQVRPRAAGVRIKEIEAAVLAQSIIRADIDPRLIWQNDGSVRVLVTRIFPSESGVKQTVAGRRKRLREALETLLSVNGWRKIGRDAYAKANSGG